MSATGSQRATRQQYDHLPKYPIPRDTEVLFDRWWGFRIGTVTYRIWEFFAHSVWNRCRNRLGRRTVEFQASQLTSYLALWYGPVSHVPLAGQHSIVPLHRQSNSSSGSSRRERRQDFDLSSCGLIHSGRCSAHSETQTKRNGFAGATVCLWRI